MQTNPERLPAQPTAEAEHAFGGLGDQLPWRLPPLMETAQEAFRRALPQLLRERPGQWVAFHGPDLIDFARTDLKLYQDCLRRGYQRGQFLVRSIEPEADEVSWGLPTAG